MKMLTFLLVSVIISTLIACGGGGEGSDGRVNNYNVNLKSLEISEGVLSPEFSPEITSYNVEVSSTIEAIDVTPEISDSSSKITVNGTAVSSGSSYTLALNTGLNPIVITVTASDNTTTKNYHISVKKLAGLSSNANLSSLEISNGTLSPVFDENTTGYNVDLPSSCTGIYVIPTVAGNNATVTVNDKVVVSGSESSSIPLTAGITVINIVVTAENGATKAYVISVNTSDSNSNANLAGLSISSGTLSPGFVSDTTSYNVYLPYIIRSVTLTPTVAAIGSTVKINEIAVISGKASNAIDLDVGANKIEVAVTSADKNTKKYTIIVYRSIANDNANLSNLTISNGKITPSFDAGITIYDAEVSYENSYISVTPTVSASNSIVLVDNCQILSGTASQIINLNVGINTIIILVVAENGNTKQYTLKINRSEANTNANLAGLSINIGSLNPTFSTDTYSYTVTVAYNVTGIRITPVVAGFNAKVTINDKTVISETASEMTCPRKVYH